MPPGALSGLSAINLRFLHGHPTNDIAEAGVIMRAFDGLENPWRPWEPCPQDNPSLAMCARFADRFPTSLVWPGHTSVYTGNGDGGLIIRPDAFKAHSPPFKCAYHGDGTTMSKGNEPCPELCTSPGAKWWRCAWPPNHLQRMMEAQKPEDHNEVVLDTSVWVASLPATIEAIYAVPYGDDSHARARGVHRDYLERYGLSAKDVPLLMYRFDQSPPFSELQ